MLVPTLKIFCQKSWPIAEGLCRKPPVGSGKIKTIHVFLRVSLVSVPGLVVIVLYG